VAEIESMTAFARCEASFEWGTLSWELRSVNHRYLELQFRLPDTLRHIEMSCRNIARNALGRGKIDCSLRLQLTETGSGSLVLDEAQAMRLIEASRRLRKLDDSLGAHSALDLLAWPGVVAQASVDIDIIAAEAERLFGQAVAELKTMRAREGQALDRLIRQRLDTISDVIAQVREQSPSIIAALRARLHERIAEFIDNPDPDRLEQEIVIQAQKADVAEELDRLDTHVKETLRTLAKGGACGRRLDFLMQEFNREANTLSSKSVASDTTQHAVDLKVLIEQMREQIQNIE